MDLLTVGVVASSRKENERRLAVHPDHVRMIPPELRASVFLETGYGEAYGTSDEALAPHVGGILSREELVARCDVVLLPKPTLADVAGLRDGQVLWGWPHCVQDPALTQLAIDKRLTLIAFEAMNHWSDSGGFLLHAFHKNNELAGYCSVIHALQLSGSTGDYGRRLKAVVIGFGATARGAVTALNAHGVHEVSVLTNRKIAAVGSPIHSADMVHLDHDDADPRRSTVDTPDGVRSLASFLSDYDVIVNCVLQDVAEPLTFLVEEDLPTLRPGTIVVDVSCDEGMGFSWARPTTFDEPVVVVGDHVQYYAVDHSPSYLWNSATWEISAALLPYLPTVLGGPEAWAGEMTVDRAVEIRDGRLVNPAIAAFQRRATTPPYDVLPPEHLPPAAA